MNVSFNPQRIRSGARASVIRGLKCVVLVIVFAFSVPVVSAQAKATTKAPLTKANKVELENTLSSHLQAFLDGHERTKFHKKNGAVRVSIDIDTATLVIRLSKEYLPHQSPGEVEDLQSELGTEAFELLRDTIDIHEVKFIYDGKSLYDYFPEQRSPPSSTKPSASINTDISPPGNSPGPSLQVTPTVVVSAGHGIYYNYGSAEFGPARWTEQRDPSNGVIEDYITPSYAAELSAWLNERSGITAIFPRSTAIMDVYVPSGNAWWMMGARYRLQETYPQYPSIWHSQPPNSTDPERERIEDFYSRPLFANHINANTLVSLHTNAGPTTARGTRVYYYPERVESQQLGNNILCYMKELIQAKTTYANWTVQSGSIAQDHAENREAHMPSVIIEVGFHTNTDDAAALQDPVFLTASMKGAEKGYRLNAAGKTACEPFKISSIPNVSGPQNTNIPANINYVGYPQFSVTRKTEIISCASGWSCSNYNGSYTSSVPSPLTFNFRCSVSSSKPTATFRWRTTLTDVDGVVTNSVEHTSTCTAPVTTTSSSKGRPSDKPTITIIPD
jgi:N-acetylmuramoyl-L-alanine amidase